MSKRADSLWNDSKTNKFGKYVIYSTKAPSTRSVKWYTEIHMHSRHGLLYRASYGSKLPFRWMAVIQTLIRYKGEQND